METDRYDAVVVGGGIVGAAAAYHLAADGVGTALVDRRDEGRATDAGAGIVSPATSSRTDDDAWFSLGADAAAYYPELDARLEAAGVGPTGYDRQGLLAVAVDEDERDPYEAALDRIDRRRLDAIEEIPPAEAEERFPPLADPVGAFYNPEAARVDGRAFTDALVAAGEAAGLSTVEADVTAIRREGGRVAGVETAGGRRIDAPNVVVAGGAWSPAFGDALGVELPVGPRRGQLAHLAVPGADTRSWPIVSGFRDHYLVPWPDGRVVAGATREPDAGFDPRTTAAGIETVLSEGLRVAPGLGSATVTDLRVGLRPVSADGRPVLGRVPGVEGAYLATGHGPVGLTLGPYSGKLVAEAVVGDGAVPEAFAAGRFVDTDG